MISFHLLNQYEFIKFNKCKHNISKMENEFKECLKKNKNDETLCYDKFYKFTNCRKIIKNYKKRYLL